MNSNNFVGFYLLILFIIIFIMLIYIIISIIINTKNNKKYRSQLKVSDTVKIGLSEYESITGEIISIDGEDFVIKTIVKSHNIYPNE